MRTKTATVVGAGIAGPAAALTLSQRHYDVTIYESRPLPYQGSIHMITLEDTAVDILRDFGISDNEYSIIGYIPHRMRESMGRYLSDSGDSIFPTIGGCRWNDVHNAMAKRLNVQYGHPIHEIPDGDIVVWADGIGSYGRKLFTPDRAEGSYSGEMLFRGYGPRPANDDKAWYNLQGTTANGDTWQMVSYATWTDNGTPVRGWTLFAPMEREPWNDTETLTAKQEFTLSRLCRPWMEDWTYNLINTATEITCAPQIVWPALHHMAFRHGNQRHYVIGDANGTVSPRTGLGANEAIFAGSDMASSYGHSWEAMNVNNVNTLLERSRQFIGQSNGTHG